MYIYIYIYITISENVNSIVSNNIINVLYKIKPLPYLIN